MENNLFDARKELSLSGGKKFSYYSLPKLEEKLGISIDRLPVSLRVVLESVLRNADGKGITEGHVRALANWKPNAERTEEIPFVVARVLLQDFTGVPLGVDLAAMRDAVAQLKSNPTIVEPLVPVDLIIDHSVQVDFYGSSGALQKNIDLEFQRNKSRYQFLRWCMDTFKSFRVFPPGFGICHQVNLEYLAPGVFERNGVFFPDTLVGTDSHTTMINGLGVVGWGVGGIEAEAAMLGQPVYILTPDVVGVNLHGALKEGVTATDLVLRVTELLRKTKVVGKFVEFCGEGAQTLSIPDRATISNMAPEYGATIGFFPPDEKTCEYLAATGRSAEQIERMRAYFGAQKMFGIPKASQCEYSTLVDLDLSSIVPSVAGPKRPQDRIDLSQVKEKFSALFSAEVKNSGYGKKAETLTLRAPVGGNKGFDIGHGDVLIAAITSCTNTSNPSVMLAAGLLAKKAVERGLTVHSRVKTSLAPGSPAVSDYLQRAGLQQYLDKLGFNIVGFGCTTCIGNSGPLDKEIEASVIKEDIIGAAVLSGNRNFEARVHQNIKANYLMSPPLVVAYALAGSTLKDLTKDSLGKGADGKDVFLRDIWPSSADIAAVIGKAFDPESYRKAYAGLKSSTPQWDTIEVPKGQTFDWDKDSTYIRRPNYFENFSLTPGKLQPIVDARALAIFGDSITTDHISPAGSIKASSPAGKYLQSRAVTIEDFNSYGARRGNHEVMIRGTFANVRIKNLMLSGVEGGETLLQPEGEKMSIYDAAIKYQDRGIATIVFAGVEYGSGSSRDWAAKGTRLLGVRAVVAQSFERIHRSNLVGMGVLPCQFLDGTNAASVGLKGDEEFSIKGIDGAISPRQTVTLVIRSKDGTEKEIPLLLRVDTPIEVEYLKHGGILPFVLRGLLRN